MTDILFQISRFVFLLSFAAFLSIALIVTFHFIRAAVRTNLIRVLKKRYEQQIQNFLFSNAVEKRNFPRIPKISFLNRKALEEVLISYVELTPLFSQSYNRLTELWESLNYPEQNIKNLRSRNKSKRSNACLALGAFCYDPAKKHVRELLQDPSEKVKWTASWALLRMRDEKNLQRILESVSHAGRFGLVQLQPDLYALSREGVFSLEEALQHPEPEVRILALGIVGRLRQHEFVRFIERLLVDPVLDVRMKALSALIDMSPRSLSLEPEEGKNNEKKQGVQKKEYRLSQDLEIILGERIQQGTWEETAKVLQVIGSWKLNKFIPDVEGQVTHLHPWVRYRALETLLQLGSEGRKRANSILTEYRHIIFPIFEDLDVRNDIQE